MVIPATAFAIPQPLDPADVDFFDLIVSQEGVGGVPFPMLRADEGVASYTLALTTEAVAFGVEIDEDDGRQTTLVDNVVQFWLRVSEDMQGAAPFTQGVTAALELTVVTTSTPPRTKQRTATVKVIQL